MQAKGYFIQQEDKRREGQQLPGDTDRAASPDNTVKAAERQELKSEMQALVNSIGIAIGHRQNKEARGQHVSGRMEDLEAMQAEAEMALRALSDPTARIQRIALSNVQAVIKTQLQADEDEKDSDKPRVTKIVAPAAPPKEDEDTVAKNNRYFFGIFRRRRDALESMAKQHKELAANSTASVDNGHADLLAAVAVAGLLAAGYANRDEIQRFVAHTRDKMIASSDGEGGFGASVEDRLALILAEGRKISESMGRGSAATQRSIVDAAENIISLHMGSQKEKGESFLANARAHLEQYDLAQVHLVKFDSATDLWQRGVADTQNHLSAELGKIRAHIGDGNASVAPAELAGLAESVSRLFADWKSYGERDAGLLEGHARIFNIAAQANDNVQATFNGLLHGKDYRGDTGKVAHALGIQASDLMAHVAAFQDAHGIAPESAEQLNERAANVNAAWANSVYRSSHSHVYSV